MALEVGQQRSRPAHAAFKEQELHIGKAPRDAAQKQRLAYGLVGRRELADMVVNIVGDRNAAAPSFTWTVEGRHDLQLATSGPYRIVVVLAVDTVSIEPESPSRGLRILLRNLRHRSLDVAGQHHHLKPALADSVVQFLDRL